MTDYYGTLASISALLSGFSFAFLGVMLTAASASTAADRTARLGTIAAALLLVTALGWSLAASATAGVTEVETARQFIDGFSRTHNLLSLLFLAGIAVFLATLGACGWLRSRSMGWFTTVTALLAGAAAVSVVGQFIN